MTWTFTVASAISILRAMHLLESPSMMQRRITFSCGESRGAVASSVATRIGSPFRTLAAASTRWGRLASSMNDRNAGGKIVSPIITSSTDLMNLSHVMTLTKYPLAPARNAEVNSFSR